MGRGPCCEKVGMKKGPWTPEEDVILLSYIQQHGPGNWRAVPANTGLLRCSKSCRLRWTNYLRPGIKRGNFTPHEEEMIIHLQALLGNKWAAIASYLPQRTDNDIKNYWNTHLKNKFNPRLVDQPAPQLSSQSESHPYPYPYPYPYQFVSNHRRRNQKGKHNVSDVRLEQNSNVYASSAENISRLLEGWRKRSESASAAANSSAAAAGSGFNINGHDLDKKNGNVENATTNSGVQGCNTKEQDEEFEPILSCYENHVNSFSSLGWEYTYTYTTATAEEKMQDENANYPPLSFLDNWLSYENENMGQPQVQADRGK